MTIGMKEVFSPPLYIKKNKKLRTIVALVVYYPLLFDIV